MDIAKRIAEIRAKKEQTEIRKQEHESFVDKFVRSAGMKAAMISTGLAMAASPLNAQEMQALSQNRSQDATEQTVSNEKLSCKVYLRVNEIGDNVTDYQQLFDYMNKYDKAGYWPDFDHIVCQTFHVSDAKAYKIGNKKKNPDLDFEYALNGFNSALQKAKYTGNMPKTLDDVENILNSGLSELKEKQQEKVQESAKYWGLDGALKVKNEVEKENKSNTTENILTHEYKHALNADIKDKALLPSSLLSPSGLFLLHAADELEAHLNGKTGAQAAADAVRKIRNTQSTRYGESWFNKVENHMGTIQSYCKQNLDITEDGRIVDNFSAQNFQKLLKEMIPDDATRKTVEMGLEELKKDELILNNTLYGGTYYDNLSMQHTLFIQNLDVEDVKSTKQYAAFSDEEALIMAQRRNKKVQDKYGAKHYNNLVDVSNNFVVENGNVKYADGVKSVKDMVKHSKTAGKTFSAEQFLAMANQGR